MKNVELCNRLNHREAFQVDHLHRENIKMLLTLQLISNVQHSADSKHNEELELVMDYF